MKKFLVLMYVLFCCCSIACANIAYEKEYWVEEINKTSVFKENMLMGHYPDTEDLQLITNIGDSKADLEILPKITLVVAEVIRNSEANLKAVHIDGYNNNEFNSFFIETLLDAIIHNETIKTLRCSRMTPKGALIVAEIIKKNRSLQFLEFEGEGEGLTDDNISAIANSLRTNNTLKNLRIRGGNFHMSSRKKLQDAWSMNKPEGRNQQIEF